MEEVLASKALVSKVSANEAATVEIPTIKATAVETPIWTIVDVSGLSLIITDHNIRQGF